MPLFSQRSSEQLATSHPDLKRLFNEVIRHYDCTVLIGHRGEAEQDAAVKAGTSKLSYPNSKHNSEPSQAVDVVPYPINWNQRERFYHFAGFVFAIADMMQIKLRWGGDWNSTGDFAANKFEDLPHFELE